MADDNDDDLEMVGVQNAGSNKARDKSPLVSSVERPGKVLKANIHTPLPACPLFPAPVGVYQAPPTASPEYYRNCDTVQRGNGTN